MILGYKKQFPWGLPTCFKGKIIDGIKKHTIRDDKHDRWRAGRRINHCHLVRTKYFDNFYNNDCIGIQKITIIHYPNKASVYIDDKLIGHWSKTFEVTYYQKLKQLAKNDGFDSMSDFFRWFDTNFTGKIIHWTELRY